MKNAIWICATFYRISKKESQKVKNKECNKKTGMSVTVRNKNGYNRNAKSGQLYQ